MSPCELSEMTTGSSSGEANGGGKPNAEEISGKDAVGSTCTKDEQYPRVT
jgi:hypothetical protein